MSKCQRLIRLPVAKYQNSCAAVLVTQHRLSEQITVVLRRERWRRCWLRDHCTAPLAPDLMLWQPSTTSCSATTALVEASSISHPHPLLLFLPITPLLLLVRFFSNFCFVFSILGSFLFVVDQFIPKNFFCLCNYFIFSLV